MKRPSRPLCIQIDRVSFNVEYWGVWIKSEFIAQNISDGTRAELGEVDQVKWLANAYRLIKAAAKKGGVLMEGEAE